MATASTTNTLANPLDERLGYIIRRLSSMVMAKLSLRLSTLGLTPTSASVLLLIEANPLVPQVEFGRALGIKRANMTPLIADLEKRGYIKREALDGKSFGFVPTKAGMPVIEQAKAEMDGIEEEFFGTISPTQQKALRALLALVES